MAKQDFISIASHSLEELSAMLDAARRLKRAPATGSRPALLAGKVLVMLFEKPSLRTRLSFQVAITHLGGSAIYVRGDEVLLGQRESAADAARVLSGYADAIVARTFGQEMIVALKGERDHEHGDEVDDRGLESAEEADQPQSGPHPPRDAHRCWIFFGHRRLRLLGNHPPP